MFDWITHNKGLFLNSYTEIGTSHPHAMELQTQHNHFAMNCMVRRPQGRRVLCVEVLQPTGAVYTDHVPRASRRPRGVTDCVVAADLQVWEVLRGGSV